MTSQELIQSLFVSDTNALGILDIFLAISLPFLLCSLVALFYRNVSRLNVYSASFIMSMPLFGSLSSIITLLIGSNIARAFGLVGALSLIRFRTAVKEPLDTIYLFWCLAIGMACGTGFYLAAVMIVFLCATYMFILTKIKFSSSPKVYLILKVAFPKAISSEKIKKFEKYIKSIFTDIEALNYYVSGDKELNEYVYSVKLKKRTGSQHLIEEIEKFDGISNVDLVSQDSALYI